MLHIIGQVYSLKINSTRLQMSIAVSISMLVFVHVQSTNYANAKLAGEIDLICTREDSVLL